jgi:hypothetical protein
MSKIPRQPAVAGGLPVDATARRRKKPFRPWHSSLSGGGWLVYMGSVAFSTLLLSIARRLIDRPFIEPELGCDLRVTGTEPPEILAGLRGRTTPIDRPVQCDIFPVPKFLANDGVADWFSCVRLCFPPRSCFEPCYWAISIRARSRRRLEVFQY